MKRHQIRLQGPRVAGTTVSAALLRNVLDVVLEGSKRAVRMRTEGRSSASGPVPVWIDSAADYSVQVKAGSTILELEAPTLVEAAPELFEQEDFLRDVDPDRSSFEYFTESLAAAAIDGDRASQLFDKGLLDVFARLEGAFEAGATGIAIENGRAFQVCREDIDRLDRLRSEIPDPQYVRVAGWLDTIRHSDRTFTMLTGPSERRIKGLADAGQKGALQELWGSHVVVTGTAHYSIDGEVLRIEAERVRRAEEGEDSLWSRVPEPLSRQRTAAALRQEQGPRSGLNAVIGRWPGEESDQEVMAVLDELS